VLRVAVHRRVASGGSYEAGLVREITACRNRLPAWIVAFRPVVQPPPVLAQDGSPYPFHIEQGMVSLRKSDGNTTWGKVVVDMRNGDVWGFPLQAQNTPYPVYGPSDTPKVSRPLYLGRMAFSEATR
jgi:hypothetical protein